MTIDIGEIYNVAKSHGGAFMHAICPAFVQCMVKEIDRHCTKHAKEWSKARKEVEGIKQRCMAQIPEGLVVSVIGPVWGNSNEQNVLYPINVNGEGLFEREGLPSWQPIFTP